MKEFYKHPAIKTCKNIDLYHIYLKIEMKTLKIYCYKHRYNVIPLNTRYKYIEIVPCKPTIKRMAEKGINKRASTQYTGNNVYTNSKIVAIKFSRR